MKPRPRAPHIFICDRCGHVVTFWQQQTSVRPRPCIQPDCGGVLFRQPNQTEQRGATVMPARRFTMIVGREGHAPREEEPQIVEIGDGSGRCWVGVICTFNGITRVHCLAPATDGSEHVVRITTSLYDPWPWDTREAAEQALKRAAAQADHDQAHMDQMELDG